MTSIQDLLHRGLALQSSGQAEEAASIYLAILKEQPSQPDASHLLGLIALARGDFMNAIGRIEAAIQLVPDSSVFWGNLGVAFRRAERIDEAVAAYRRALKLDPKNADAQFNLGKSLRLQGQVDEAKDCFVGAIASGPTKSAPYLSLMNLYVEQRKLSEAEEVGTIALSRCPANCELHLSLGAVYKRQNRIDKALEHYQAAVALSPANVDAICRIASTLITRHGIEEGKEWLNRAMRLEPNSVHVLNSLGLLHNTLGDTTNAVRVFRQAVATHPNYATAFANFSSALKKQGALSEALENILRARELEPTSAESMVLEGGIRMSMGSLEKADHCFRSAIKMRGTYRDAHDSLLMCQQYRAETTQETLLDEHRKWNATSRYSKPEASGNGSRENANSFIEWNRPLRVGFVSADLGAHPVGYFSANLFRYLDRQRFQTFVYSDRIGRDWLASTIEQDVHKWYDSASWTDEKLYECIHRDEIDILFDLAGHTAYNRLPVFAKRVAPLQISWAGYVGTTGLSEMDGLIADRFHVPEGTEKYYTEKILRMPNGYVSYLAPEDCPDVSELPSLRNGFVTFCAMCNPAKVNEGVLKTWGEVLSRLPGSRLLLSYCGWNDPANQHRVRDSLSAFNCSDRVDFSFLPSSRELLGLYRQVDIALDTFPYSGGLTTIEALWMGVPTVTWPGDTFAGRHSLSHLMNVGLNEMVASSMAEYADIAVKLANDLGRLRTMRAGLRQSVLESPLCNGPLFSRDFETLMRRVWDETVPRVRYRDPGL